MKLRFAALLVVSCFAFGCGRTRQTGTSPEPVAATGESNPVLNTRSAWTIISDTRQHQYRAVSSSLLELSDTAGITRDSITAVVDFTLSMNRVPEALSYSATVVSMSAQGGVKTGTAMSARLPFSFGGRFSQSQLTLEPSPGQPASVLTDCSNEALSSTPVIQRAIVPMPLALQKDMTWTDSVSTVTCSGSIPVTSVAVRRYRVVGETIRRQTAGILLERQDKTTSAGEGSQGQHRIRLRSDGSGTAQLIVDSQTGALVESNATHTATVVITSSGRDQRFTQRTREKISGTP